MSLFEFKSPIFAMAVLLITLSSKSSASDQQTPLSDQSFESSSCPNIDNTVFLVQKNVDCENLDRLLLISRNVQKISPVPIPLTRVIMYKERFPFQNVSFDNLVTLTAENTERTLEQNNILWVHEIGHMIFNTLLSQDFDEYRNLVLISKEKSNNVWKSMNQYISPPTVIHPKITDFISGYSELFADFVTVVYKNDLDSTYSAFDKNSSKYDDMKRFSFLKKNQDESCEDWQHFYFTYSRPIIAKKFLFNITTVAEKKAAILDFYKFISKDLVENWKKYGSKVDCKKANQELIEKLTSR